MKSPLLLVVGIVVALAGLLFTLQGIGVVSGSSMSNSATWAVLGPIIAVLGLVVAYRGSRPRQDRA